MDSEPNDQLIPRWQAPGATDEIYDVAKAAMLAGISSRTFLKYFRLGLYQSLGDASRQGYQFDWEAVYLARQAERVRARFCVEMRVATLVVKLKKENEVLREELRFWRR
ncbi:hypothetical protein [Pelagicoccus sp. SDUM812002]|uniref:hypothetical protein n=1 Tax=Pelagicoccus sp. SDUM812002 TaxID=3041266 RepID=UPI00280FFC1C|nr:hypothetical protein [Pelagicoccus sp. SDUM812002]MDQ8187107.1 hypothetical protein [Pelagicoccus sp. SDUM812002]